MKSGSSPFFEKIRETVFSLFYQNIVLNTRFFDTLSLSLNIIINNFLYLYVKQIINNQYCCENFIYFNCGHPQHAPNLLSHIYELFQVGQHDVKLNPFPNPIEILCKIFDFLFFLLCILFRKSQKIGNKTKSSKERAVVCKGPMMSKVNVIALFSFRLANF